MSEYNLELRQIVDYPRCRIYRQLIQTLMADRSIRVGGSSGLFYFSVLCCYKVARFLYPNANLENGDVRNYKPDIRFDYVLGNPPFNLRWDTEYGERMTSQRYYCVKAAELLKPFGIMAIITPAAFLADEFTNGSEIEEMETYFRFLGQLSLPADAFASMGIPEFATKLQFWQRKEQDEHEKSYHTALDGNVKKGFGCKETAEWISDRLLAYAKKRFEDNTCITTRPI